MRHGEVHNPKGILYGRLPGYRLSELGQAMAQQVADVLANEHTDVRAVIASPLLRAQETAEPIGSAFGHKVQSDDRLLEADTAFEGMAVRNDLMQFLSPTYWRYLYNPFKPSWGEPYRDIVKRMSGAVISAIDVAEGGQAVLVSHQLPIWTMRLFLEGRSFAHDPRIRQCALASLTSLEFEGRTLVGLSYREPAADLLLQARDIVPGKSEAAINTGQPES